MCSEFESYSIWDMLSSETRPILLYGTGNGADKIIAACNDHGITIDGIFASDFFVRDRTFHDMKVLSYTESVKKYGNDIVVLLAFGTNRPEIIDFIRELDARHTLIIPEVPLYGGELFDRRYFEQRRDKYSAAAHMLCDDESVKLFYDAVNFRLTGKLKYLERCENISDTLKILFKDKEIITAVDGGAYKGDTLECFISCLRGLNKVYAVEPDPKTFRKLTEYSKSITGCDIVPVNAALSDSTGSILYTSSASRGSAVKGQNKRAKEISVNCTTIDELTAGEEISLIKLDVEGNEAEAIKGAVNTIRKNTPAMMISLYHRTDDLTDIISAVHDLYPHYKFYLRRPFCIPMWDLNLFAVPD